MCHANILSRCIYPILTLKETILTPVQMLGTVILAIYFIGKHMASYLASYCQHGLGIKHL